MLGRARQRARRARPRRSSAGASHDEVDFMAFPQGTQPRSSHARPPRRQPRAIASSTSRSAADTATTRRSSAPFATRSVPSRCCASTRTRRGTFRAPSTRSGGSKSSTSTGSSSRWQPPTSPAWHGSGIGRHEDRRRPGACTRPRSSGCARGGGRRRDRARQPRVGRPLAVAPDGVSGGVVRNPDEPPRLPGERDLDLRCPAGDGLHPEPDAREPGHAPPDHRAAHDDADRDRRAAAAPSRPPRASASRSTWMRSSGRASATSGRAPY